MVKDSKPELLKRLLLQTGLTDISTENTPEEGACHIHVLRVKSVRREKLLPPRMHQDLLEVCSKSHTPYFECISTFKLSSVVVLLQCSVLSARCGTMETSHPQQTLHQ